MSENVKTILLGIGAMVVSIITGFVMINICRAYLEGSLEILLVVVISIIVLWNVFKQIPWIIENMQR